MEKSAKLASDIDPWSEKYCHSPERFFDELRAMPPVFPLTKYDCWGVAQYGYASEVLSDPVVFSSAGGSALANFFKEKPWRQPSLLLETDPPEHTVNRRVITRAMSPKAIRDLKGRFDSEAQNLIDRVSRLDVVDGVADIADVYPLKVFPDSVGLRLSDDEREALLIYGQMVMAGMGPETELSRSLSAHAPRVLPLIEQKCRRDALEEGGFGAAIYDAVDEGLVNEEDASLIVRSFLSAGLDTTRNALALMINLLAQNPDAYNRLREDRSLIRNAFDEMLRLDGPAPFIFRTTSREVNFHGVNIPKHEKIMIFIGAANTDPAHWENADSYDIGRQTRGHLGFGAGIHGCVGQMVARMEGESVVNSLLDRFTRIEPAGPGVRSLVGGIRGFGTLPVRLVP